MEIINLPNILTSLRIVILPFLALLIWQNYTIEALLLFLVAASTDLFDGYFARRLGKITAFGACFDPFADKIFFLSILVLMSIRGVIPLSFTGVILLRDVFVLLGSIFSVIYFGYSSIRPHIAGKLVNMLLFVIIFFKLFSLSCWTSSAFSIFEYLLYVMAIFFSLLSFFIYVRRAYYNLSPSNGSSKT